MYWEKPGIKNTELTINQALKRIKELGIEHVVVASSTGMTAKKFIGLAPNIICVTLHYGFNNPGENKMQDETRRFLEERGVKLLTTTHLFAGIDRALRNKYGGIYPAEIVAATLRMFGHGVKVCIEITTMALDAGLIPHGKDVVSVAGTGAGADSACVISPQHSNNFFENKIREIICKPANI